MNHLENRRLLVEALREELVGPSPRGQPVNCSGNVTFPAADTPYGPWQQENGEEILQRDPPIVRYGVGVLYPIKTTYGADPGERGEPEEGVPPDEPIEDVGITTEGFTKDVEAIAKRATQGEEPDSDDLELPTANAMQPSSMGLSFLVDFAADAELIIEVSGGQYRKKVVTVTDRERIWWLSRPVSFRVALSAQTLKASPKTSKTFQSDPLHLSVEVFTRPYGRHHLLTVSLINRTSASTSGNAGNEVCLFQTAFKAAITVPDGKASILPYPSAPFSELDEEEQSLALLYRKAETYAVGHGCAANWRVQGNERRAEAVYAECLPAFETPSTTPDITREDGSRLEVPMAALAGLVRDEDGLDAFDEVIARYETWTLSKQSEAERLEARYQAAAAEHLKACEKAARRMRGGLEYLRTNPTALRAFRLANEAILIQQVQSKRPQRAAAFDRDNDRYTFTPHYETPNILTPKENAGSWRPFQIAFLLMSLESAVENAHQDRTEVELIWFPTGGGKTEAYLGLAAFSLFMRRLKDPADAGVHVLMRYTLRLLTAQQFQRASALVCAMEHLRKKHTHELGDVPFSIGIWLGGGTTPNSRRDADHALKELERKGGGENPFILGRCPWCAAEMGVFEGSMPKKMSKADKILGYKRTQGTVAFYCPDRNCEFSKALPVYVIDEDIYEQKPSIVIGTVDKFAVLAWRAEARSLFGLDASGKREVSPPGLIIQDELHLISGPLGSMVGLYETLIEELCTDRRDGAVILPKIVCSTATIRSYREQVRALYGRRGVTLFPPPGLEDGDSFFARHAVDEQGERLPGKLYVGVNAPGLRSLETSQERTFAALLQAPMPLTPEERDPWWTLLLFFGSLRELGTSLSLFQSRIPDYFKTIKNRQGLDFKDLRYLYRPEELTGRLRNDEVPKALAKLEIACTPENTWAPGSKAVKAPAVDVCLASSIIEVGVDVDRLSLMAVVRQPKTTAQYIQVTGRVGRKWWERPGLVVTLYNPKNARDRSHFEQFRSYHEKLYAQVEPTSVTPFAPPVLDRALHGVMVAYALQTGDETVAESPYPYPQNLIETLRNILMPRVLEIDPQEAPYFEEIFDKRAKEWQDRQRTKWRASAQDEEIPLTVRAGEYVSPERALLTWKTPNSMRNVDTECQAQITQLYLTRGEE